MKTEDPLYALLDHVRTPDGLKIVLGREYYEWSYKGKTNKGWTYHCMPLTMNKKTKELERTGVVNRHSKNTILGLEK